MINVKTQTITVSVKETNLNDVIEIFRKNQLFLFTEISKKMQEALLPLTAINQEMANKFHESIQRALRPPVDLTPKWPSLPRFK